MRTLYSVFYLFLVKNFEPDQSVAKLRASIFLALIQTCNVFSLIAVFSALNLIIFKSTISILFVGFTGVIFSVINFFFFRSKKELSKKEKVLSWSYSILSIVVFAIFLAEYDLFSKGRI